jgi:ABC-2 type transport system permease protein
MTRSTTSVADTQQRGGGVTTSLLQAAAVARQELRVLRQDPAPLTLLVFMPLLLIAFMQDAFRPVLVEEGFAGATGAEQAVPGMSVMFAFFLVGHVGFSFYREHGWATWERLRATAAPPAAIMAGKVVVPVFVCLLQLGVLFAVGVLAFGLVIAGSLAGLALVAVAFAWSLVTLGVCVVALTRSIMQMNALSNLGAIVLAGLGGALMPLASLPSWAQAIGPGVPSYWAMRGFQDAILTESTLGDALLPAAVLLGFAGLFGALALVRFRFEETKTSWA